jgi:hypothetical protein
MIMLGSLNSLKDYVKYFHVKVSPGASIAR